MKETKREFLELAIQYVLAKAISLFNWAIVVRLTCWALWGFGIYTVFGKKIEFSWKTTIILWTIKFVYEWIIGYILYKRINK